MGFGTNGELMDARSKVSFCSGSCHAEHILQVLNSYRRSGTFTDVVLQVDGCEFPCHRATLCASSLFFRTMFSSSSYLENQQPVVQLHGISSTAMDNLLDFMYEGRLKLDEENVESVFQAADRLDVPVLSKACVQFLQERVSHSNCLGLMDFASLYVLEPLQEQCQTLLYQDFQEVLQHDEFLGLPKARVLELLACERLQVSEEVLVTAALRWVHQRPDERKQDLRELLERLRLPLLDPAFFSAVLEADETVQECVELRPLLQEARMYRVFGREVQSERTKPRRCSGWAELIFVIGGCDKNGFSRLSFTEKLNVWSGEWTAAPSLPGYSKSEFATCELQNDIYVSGGQLNSADVWRFMPQISHWVRVRGLSRGRWRHKMTSLCGKLYVVGGYNGRERLSSVERYSPHENSWTSVSDLLLPVSSAAVSSCCGKLYIIGGAVSDHNNTDRVQCYDPVSDRWSYVSSCPFSQRSITAVTLNSCIYVTGGLLEHIYSYTPHTDSWSRAAELPVKLEGCGLTVCDGKVYVVGGRDEHSVALDQIWAFDPVTGKVTEEKPLTRCLSYHGCVTVLQRL
ncbi:kelch-like protein 35 isoform X1 [Carassius gibelio]|uniref:kelch-like protein 35 isoform X1 n=1 Tax=Carassius gibelio TaxID=101364 RepID=UPI0022795941|nr:kelch-like protein 35 isoform X1 [Carassius gibelio]WEX30566.1 Kelch-like protein 12816 [Carassius gibelio]WEX30567.1 Kelch-like protein 12844 [Carassius gibelio]